MTLGRHHFLGRDNDSGKGGRFLSKLTTSKERGKMRKLKYVFEKIERERIIDISQAKMRKNS